MKICIDARILELPLRGMGLFTKKTLEEILVQDKKNEYILLMNDPEKLKRKFWDGANVAVKKVFSPWGFGDLFSIPFAVNKIKPESFWCPANTSSPFIGRETKVVTTIHDLMFFSLKFLPFSKQQFGAIYRKFFSKIAVKRSNWIHTVSKFSQQEISRVFSIDSRKIFVTYEGPIDLVASDTDVLEKLGLNGQRFIYTISGDAPHKNLQLTISAFRHLRKIYYKENLKLVVSGTKKQSGETDIIFTNYVSEGEKNSLLKNCSLFVFFSQQEGFGIPPLEALFWGRKVLISDIKVFREIFGCYAFFTPLEKPEGIAIAIKNALERQPISLNFLELKQKFSWGNVAEELLARLI